MKKIQCLVSVLLLVLVFTLASTGISLAAPVQNPNNGHYYEVIAANDIGRSEAHELANNSYFQGIRGHLATVTSAEENNWLLANFSVGRMWIGGYQDTDALDYREPDGGWRWVTGEEWDYTYWRFGEPNNYGGVERYLAYSSFSGWCDINTPLRGYIVEYGLATVPESIVNRDNAPMALIPAGTFSMGRVVYVSGFYIDRYEVTNSQYKRFMDATGQKAPKHWDDSNFNAPDHPVVGVNWYDAVAYATWAGKRLPTEAEWEWAARGGLVGQKYSWGNNEPDGRQCNFADRNTDYSWSNKYADDGYKYTSPVGSFPPNGYGLYDMIGNVDEWCSDWYGWYSSSQQYNPTGPSSGTYRILRGSAWRSRPEDVGVAARYYFTPLPSHDSTGFRCVLTAYPYMQVGVIGIEMGRSVDSGDSFSVAISAVDIVNLAGFQFDVLFEPNILEAVSVKEGMLLAGAGGRYCLEPSIDNITGRITGIACTRVSRGGVSGSGTLASIIFRAIGAGESHVRLQGVVMSDPDGNQIPVTILEGSVTVIGWPPWDVNKDGRVDILDLVLVYQYLGVHVITPLDPNPDVNGDGIVSPLDLVLVCQHFGEVYQLGAPSRDMWKVGPQYQPMLTQIYNIMEKRTPSDPSFVTAMDILRRLMFSAPASRTAVFQNYPNPFNPETWIPYQLAEGSGVNVAIYSVTGQLVRLLDLGYKEAGQYITRDVAAYWDGTTAEGETVSSGVYFYNIRAGGYTATKKMIMSK